MPRPFAKKISRLKKAATTVWIGRPALASIPALCLVSYWLGGEVALMGCAAGIPVFYLLCHMIFTRSNKLQEPINGLYQRSAFEELVEEIYSRATALGRQSVLITLAIEDFDQLSDRYGQRVADMIVNRIGDRLTMVMRKDDHVGRMGDARFCICSNPVRHLDLETCIQLAGRLQVAIEEPISVDGSAVYITASIGFCLHSRAPEESAKGWLSASKVALRAAQRHGPSAIRAFSEQMRRESKTRANLREEVSQALDGGQILPWFQPQISTETGEITGFEALARWSHPTRGMVSPAEFLPTIEDAGLMERLAEVIVYHGFAALKAWEKAGVVVPKIGINFASSDLSNPRLLEKLKWELDRFDLAPERLAVEVLETVVASSPDDIITLNINALDKLGCCIDLDDFGTGHASIAAIQKFAVSRIKIDRTFVMKADRDPEQQRMISAILTMAERLQVETLAEGVESVGEHVLLSQLGCNHVQGYGIARPMPYEQTLEWIARHNAKLENVPRIMGGRTG